MHLGAVDWGIIGLYLTFVLGIGIVAALRTWMLPTLVDGDLTLDGIVTIAGVVVVRGALQSSNGALRLNGALLLEQGGVLSAGSLVQFSRCATERALDGAALARAARRRSWAEVTR